MDETTRTVLQRVVRKVPATRLREVLRTWGRVPARQLDLLDFSTSKFVLFEDVRSLCEENRLTLKHVCELEMIYFIGNPAQGVWRACHLTEPDDDVMTVELRQFKEQFKARLTELISNVSVKIKKHDDEAVWIRIAWGDHFHRPNQLKPTYVVHHLQTPYVFVYNLSTKHKPLLYQALVLATRHGSMKDSHLSGKSLTSIRDFLMRSYQQAFPTKYARPLQEKNTAPTNPNIEKEHAEQEEKRLQLACEAFGEGNVPRLETATYKLETRYRGSGNETLNNREEPFRALIKFSSANLLVSLNHCVSAGMAETPVTPLLSSITQKGKNYFVITDKGSGNSSQSMVQKK
ncbi:centromere protein N [Denticeps clupeoides]|uniref:centromere protein N n=1 Tax=Denticeps clupeoides TaxID=299321 RepID=UPI0010A42E22|nr:centromere protein N [Denticeps clupeoides]